MKGYMTAMIACLFASTASAQTANILNSGMCLYSSPIGPERNYIDVAFSGSSGT